LKKLAEAEVSDAWLCLRWDQVAQGPPGPGATTWRLRLRRSRLPGSCLASVLAAVVGLIAVSYAEEPWRCTMISNPRCRPSSVRFRRSVSCWAVWTGRWLIVQRGLADGQMLVAGGVQFVVGCVLEREQGVVGSGYGQEDLVELALGCALMAGLAVLDDEDHRPRPGIRPRRSR
jgi:hypothetical protein